MSNEKVKPRLQTANPNMNSERKADKGVAVLCPALLTGHHIKKSLFRKHKKSGNFSTYDSRHRASGSLKIVTSFVLPIRKVTCYLCSLRDSLAHPRIHPCCWGCASSFPILESGNHKNPTSCPKTFLLEVQSLVMDLDVRAGNSNTIRHHEVSGSATPDARRYCPDQWQA